MSSETSTEMSESETDEETREESRKQVLYKLTLEFGSGNNIEYLFACTRKEYQHAHGHDISLGDVRGPYSEVNFVLNDECCEEVTDDQHAIVQLSWHLPIGIDVVDHFYDYLRGGSYDDCECVDCIQYLKKYYKEEAERKKKI